VLFISYGFYIVSLDTYAVLLFADSKEENSIKRDVKENGAVKTSGGKCLTHICESEQEEGELSEDCQLGSGDSSSGCVNKKTLSKCSTQTDTEIRDEQTKESCRVNKQSTNLVGDLGKDGGNRDSEVTVKKQEGDRMASGKLTGDLELSDEEEPATIKAGDRKCSGEAEQKEKRFETRTKPKDGREVVTDAGGGESKGGGEDDLVEVEDEDDYLVYLEEILKTVHKAFYDLYDELNGEVPDLKSVIPYVRRKLLAGTSLVFSGLVPTHTPLEKSRAYLLARSMGAQVTQDLTPETTHLVAVRPGTVKVNAARRAPRNIFVVTPDWLWCCAERWEKVDER
jgi:RNA polymerase II subunit A-like phosphatase